MNLTPVIDLRQPAEALKANVFWGLLFGLLLAVPPLFAPEDVPLWKRIGLVAAGVAWMAFMGRMALRNRSRRVRCDGATVFVTEGGTSRSFALAEVRRVQREDLRAQLRAVDQMGMTRQQKFHELNTLPRMVFYVLRDTQGRELLRLDEACEPKEQMNRMVEVMGGLTGQGIEDAR